MSDQEQLKELIKKRNDALKARAFAKFKCERKRLLKRIEGLTAEIKKLRGETDAGN